MGLPRRVVYVIAANTLLVALTIGARIAVALGWRSR